MVEFLALEDLEFLALGDLEFLANEDLDLVSDSSLSFPKPKKLTAFWNGDLGVLGLVVFDSSTSAYERSMQ